jgi:hypothetical protein
MIRLELPWLPPTSNHAYTNGGFGDRVLSAAGRKFKNTTKAHLAQRYPRELMLFKPNKPYLVLMRFHFEKIENSGYAEGKAKARYKVFDGGNRTKLLEDALKEAGGIDDAQTLTSIWQKVPAKSSSERTLIWAWSLEEESTPFDEPLRLLI